MTFFSPIALTQLVSNCDISTKANEAMVQVEQRKWFFNSNAAAVYLCTKNSLPILAKMLLLH